MTKMPEPVAYFYEWELDKNKNPYPQGIGVITTTQAEAYANERVRDALNEVLQILETHGKGHGELYSLTGDSYNQGSEAACEFLKEKIEPLIPKEQS